ncbi:MAG TPA: hypothetical protein VKX16_16875 [Chloroflexota bacterium]|nr:hypothetical protein [Chloroflexota bacterium]
MIRLSRYLIAGTALAAVAGVGVPGHGMLTASAQTGTGYKIVYSQQYCTDGSYSCSSPGSIQNLRYADVSLWSYSGAMGATPDAATIECGTYYIDGQGDDHFDALYASVGPQGYGFDGGMTWGRAAASPGANETWTAAQSSFNVGGSDPITGVLASAAGSGTTDNVADVLTSGSATISLTGWFYDYNFDTGVYRTHVKYGSLTCSVSSSRAYFIEYSEALASTNDPS